MCIFCLYCVLYYILSLSITPSRTILPLFYFAKIVYIYFFFLHNQTPMYVLKYIYLSSGITSVFCDVF